MDLVWMRIYEAPAQERDLDLAVRNCDQELFWRTRLWLTNALSERQYMRIQAIFDGEVKRENELSH